MTLTVAPDVARHITREYYGVDAEVSSLGGERDDNFRVATSDSTWVLKILHGAEPWAVTRFQSEILVHLAGSQVSAPQLIATVDGEPHARLDCGRAIRMTTYSPGTKIRSVKSQNLIRLGGAVADLDAALAGLDPGDYRQDLAWDLQRPERAYRLLDDLPRLDPDGTLRSAFDHFSAEVLPRLAALPSRRRTSSERQARSTVTRHWVRRRT